jgi:hypothetical protein
MVLPNQIFRAVRKDHPEGISKAISNSAKIQGAAARGFTPNFAQLDKNDEWNNSFKARESARNENFNFVKDAIAGLVLLPGRKIFGQGEETEVLNHAFFGDTRGVNISNPVVSLMENKLGHEFADIPAFLNKEDIRNYTKNRTPKALGDNIKENRWGLVRPNEFDEVELGKHKFRGTIQGFGGLIMNHRVAGNSDNWLASGGGGINDYYGSEADYIDINEVMSYAEANIERFKKDYGVAKSGSEIADYIRDPIKGNTEANRMRSKLQAVKDTGFLPSLLFKNTQGHRTKIGDSDADTLSVLTSEQIKLSNQALVGKFLPEFMKDFTSGSPEILESGLKGSNDFVKGLGSMEALESIFSGNGTGFAQFDFPYSISLSSDGSLQRMIPGGNASVNIKDLTSLSSSLDENFKIRNEELMQQESNKNILKKLNAPQDQNGKYSKENLNKRLIELQEEAPFNNGEGLKANVRKQNLIKKLLQQDTDANQKAQEKYNINEVDYQNNKNAVKNITQAQTWVNKYLDLAQFIQGSKEWPFINRPKWIDRKSGNMERAQAPAIPIGDGGTRQSVSTVLEAANAKDLDKYVSMKGSQYSVRGIEEDYKADFLLKATTMADRNRPIIENSNFDYVNKALSNLSISGKKDSAKNYLDSLKKSRFNSEARKEFTGKLLDELGDSGQVETLKELRKLDKEAEKSVKSGKEAEEVQEKNCSGRNRKARKNKD